MRVATMLGSLLSVPILASALCLTDNAALKVANNFGTILSNYSVAFVNQTMAVDLTDQTDSVSWLINNGTDCPLTLGATTLASRADFIQAQGSQPNLPFVLLNTYHDCTNVFLRWKFDIKPQQVQGITFLATVTNPDITKLLSEPYLIKNIYTEFNTGAFITNLGYYQGTNDMPPSCAGAGPGKRDAEAEAMPDALRRLIAFSA